MGPITARGLESFPKRHNNSFIKCFIFPSQCANNLLLRTREGEAMTKCVQLNFHSLSKRSCFSNTWPLSLPWLPISATQCVHLIRELKNQHSWLPIHENVGDGENIFKDFPWFKKNENKFFFNMWCFFPLFMKILKENVFLKKIWGQGPLLL